MDRSELLGWLLASGAIYLISSIKEVEKPGWLKFAAAVSILTFGVYLIKATPYAAYVGVILILLAVVFQSWTKSAIAWRLGLVSALAGLNAFCLSLFMNPSSTKIDLEDRTDWVTPINVERTPSEILAVPWSSNDASCYWPVSSLMLDLCKICYEPPVTAREQIKQMGFESETITAGAMQGYVINAGEYAILVFRGTEHDYYLLQDLLFLKKREAQGAMHSGFANGYDSMHDQVIKILESYNPKKVWITGHSLGGGLAVRCAYRILEEKKYEIAGVMTFGQPMTVTASMGYYLNKQLDGKYVFFVNDMDVVTRVIAPYEHFGHMVRWNDNGIQRSPRLKMGLYGSGGSTAENEYVETLTEEKLDLAIQELEPEYDDEGHMLAKGTLPSVYDHLTGSYETMLEKLRTFNASESVE